MNLLKQAEFKVGILVLVVSALFIAMTMGVNEDPSYLGRAKAYWFVLEDASGLVEKSSVKSAGINIGVIKKIKLQEGLARVEVSLSSDVELRQTARVEIRALGILGDKYIDISIGEGALLADGSELKEVYNRSSMNTVMNDVGNVADSIKEISVVLKDAVAGSGDKKNAIGRVVLNLEKFTHDLSQMSSDNKQQMNEIITNLNGLTKSLNKFLSDESDDGFQESWRKMVDSFQNVEKSLANLKEITEKVNSGQGTLGKLVNDEETINEINEAVHGVNEFLGSASKLQTSLDLHSEFMTEQGLAKTYVGVRFQPGLDRYYDFQLISDPKGVVERKIIETSVGSGPVTTTSETINFKDDVKFSAIFAKTFYDFTLKAGLMESSAGIGFEYELLRSRLKLVLDAFDFDEDNAEPHLRSYLKYDVLYGFYLLGGADDFLNSDTYSAYLGAGLSLTNDDLTMLFSKVPF